MSGLPVGTECILVAAVKLYPIRKEIVAHSFGRAEPSDGAGAGQESRRRRFLGALNWGWLGMGVLALITLPLYPKQAVLEGAIAAATLATFTVVKLLMSRGDTAAAAGVFTVLVDLGLFVIFLIMASASSVAQALETETPALMMMGLAILFAGALVDPRAPFVLALLNSLLLAGLVHGSGGDEPRFSIHVFWWLLALVAWLYERTLEDAFGRLSAASRDLQVLVDQRTGELRESVKRLSRTMAALESTNRELDAFASAVSHDLRAPVRSVIGFSDALHHDHGSELSAKAMEHLSRVRRAGRRMSALIDDLLRLSRVTRQEIRRETIDLGAVARNILEELRRSEPDRELLYRSPDVLAVVGDGRLLPVLLENLLGNAWKFTRPRRPALIELGERTIDGERVCFVRDNGVGFDMVDVEKLFRPFQRLHSTREFEGTGIGLATAQRIVQRHGGRIWAEGEENEGASFFFTLESTEPLPEP
jgi:signal transduction histidine kinase